MRPRLFEGALSIESQPRRRSADVLGLLTQFRPITGWTAPQLVETGDTISAMASKPAVGFDAGSDTFVAVWLQAGIGFSSVYASHFQ
jgi:hypothetical protein